MSRELLSAREAAAKLGISIATLYNWLAQSDHGSLVIRGRSVTIDYLQGGPRGQGRIVITAEEVDRIRELMRVHPQPAPARRESVRRQAFPGINVPLGRPDDIDP